MIMGVFDGVQTHIWRVSNE